MIMKNVQNNEKITPLISEIEKGQVQEHATVTHQVYKSSKVTKRRFDAYLDLHYFEPHWNDFKKIIDFYYPVQDYKKYYIALRSFFSYFTRPKTTIVVGEHSDHLIKGVLKLHPEKYVLKYAGVNNLDLISEEWNDIKLAYFVYFEENKELIYNRYMRNVSEFKIRTKKGVYAVPNVSLITRTKKEILPSRFKSSLSVIELSSLEEHVKEMALFESSKLGKRLEHDKRKSVIKDIIKRFRRLVDNFDCAFQVEISYFRILQSSFNLKDTVLPFKEFLDLLRIITFFNQNYRDWYEVNSTGKKYLVSHPNDFIMAYEIALHLFSVPISNLKPVKQHFFDFIVKRAHEKMKRSELTHISIFDIQLDQSKIIRDYPGSSSTLRLWLKEFCSSLKILTQSQNKKNAKIYFSLNKIAPLTISNFNRLFKRITRAYTSRVSILKAKELKNKVKIKVYPLKKEEK